MNEQCEDCLGLLGVGGPHECHPDEVFLVGQMKLQERAREAAAYEKAAQFLASKTWPWKGTILTGLELAVEALAGEAKRLRAL